MASKGTLTLRILGDEKPLKKSMDRASGTMKGWAKGAVGIFAGLGVAGAAVLVKEFGDGLARGKMQDKLAAQLNLTEGEAKKAGKIAGDLYVDAYGDSLGQVHDAVGAVMSSLGDLDDGEVEDLTAKALDLASAFDVDVSEAVNAAGVLMRNGLARDGDHAFDLIVRSMQKVPAQMRGELIPILEEYAQDFDALGINGEDAFGLLVDAAKDGRYELDKTGDAIKEFTIRSTDMSTASVEAYEAIGLSAEDMANDILAGGDTARGALDKIVEGLLDVEDPAARAEVAIALFGTPIEDLSVSEIPEFLRRLSDMDTSLGTVEGAAEDMGDTLNDNVATKIESFKRRATTAIDTWVAESVLPRADEVIEAFEEDGVGGALDKALELWEEAWPDIEAWFQETAIPKMKEWGTEAAAAFVEGINGIDLLPDPDTWLRQQLPSWVPGSLPKPGPGDAEIEMRPVDPTPTTNRPVLPGPSYNPDRTSGTGGRFHSGGMITSSLPKTYGLRSDERQIIAQTGEMVLSRRQVAGMGGGVTVNINAGSVVGSHDELIRLVQRGLREYNRRAGTTAIA